MFNLFLYGYLAAFIMFIVELIDETHYKVLVKNMHFSKCSIS